MLTKKATYVDYIIPRENQVKTEMQTYQNMQSGVYCCHGNMPIEGLQRGMNAEFTALCTVLCPAETKTGGGVGLESVTQSHAHVQM